METEDNADSLSSTWEDDSTTDDTTFDGLDTGDSSEEVASSQLPAEWIDSLGEDEPCGPNLEYDSDFLDAVKIAAGKEETQFAPAEPPDWPALLSQAEMLLPKSRDLRIAVYWLRAKLALEGLVSLGDSFELIHKLAETHWQHLHPHLDEDDNDPYARINTLTFLTAPLSGQLELKSATVLNSRSTGQITVRTCLIANGDLGPKEGETTFEKSQLQEIFSENLDQSLQVRKSIERSLEYIESICQTFSNEAGWDKVPDLSDYNSLLKVVLKLLPEEPSETDSSSEFGLDEEDTDSFSFDNDEHSSSSKRSGSGSFVPGEINSREDAIKAIEMVCDYLEAAEPSNPAQLLLRRAMRLMNNNFLELLKELAPDALAEVAKIMGVSLDSIGGDASGGGDTSESSNDSADSSW